MSLLQLSWKNLTSKPLAMLLSLVLFALGVGMISLMLLLNKQLQDKFDKNLAGIDLVIGAKGSPLQMVLSSMYHIDNPTGNVSIKEVKPFLNPKHPLISNAIPLSLGDSYKGYRIVGTLPKYLDLYEAKVGEGKMWAHTFEVVVGATVAKTHGLKVGDEFQSSHGFILDDNLIHEDAHALKVVGLLEESGSVIDQLILCNPQTVWDVHDHGGEAPTEDEHDHEDHAGHDHGDHAPEKPLLEYPDKDITTLLLQFKSKTNIQALNMLRGINENTDLLAASPAIELNRLYDMMDVGEQTLRVLAIIIIFVSALSIFISLFSSLKDRKYELALMRVMGASRSKVFSLIILEGLILASLGFLIGMVLSHVGMEILGGALKDSFRYSFTGMMFLADEIKLLGGALLIGLLAAIIPAVQASNTDISTTLASG